MLVLYLIAWAHVNFYNGFDQNPYLKLHGFHAFSVLGGMANIRLVMAMTLDGFLPDGNDPLMQWVKTSRHGFPYWHERSSFCLPIGYPMLDLIVKKESKDDSFIYLAEISDEQQIELLIKIGKDRQSEVQKAIERKIKAAGGHYAIIRCFDDFILEIDS